MNETTELLRRLCGAPGTSGWEDDAADVIETLLGEVCPQAEITRDAMGSVTAFLGQKDAPRQVLLDAHLDQIGLVVTSITDEGFLRFAPVGGMDRRVLPGSAVTVYGKEISHGFVTFLPPHLTGGKEDECPNFDELTIDLGLTKEECESLVSLGDRITVDGPFRTLLGSRIAGSALDDRAGCAALLLCAKALSDRILDCGVTFAFTGREETGCEGAKTTVYRVAPTEAIIVDVTFGDQPGVPAEKCGKLGGGPMIGTAPSLSRAMFRRLKELCETNDRPYQVEVMGGSTGTNADVITVNQDGVASSVVSIPLRYMHTPTEVIDLRDVEAVADLLTDYVTGGDR